jgi:Leucine-rich repeat (LRR) protein
MKNMETFNGITTLFIIGNIKFDILPNNLIHLYCYDNKLTSLPTLPYTLTYLNCVNNRLSSLPTLPNSLTHV